MSKKQANSSKTRPTYTEAAKRAIVKQVDAGLSKSEASRKYKVSATSIYKWLNLYSSKFEKSKMVVVQTVDESESYRELNAKIDELYGLIGRSQTENMYLHKLIDFASLELNLDLKKSFANKSSAFSKSKKSK